MLNAILVISFKSGRYVSDLVLYGATSKKTQTKPKRFCNCYDFVVVAKMESSILVTSKIIITKIVPSGRAS